jgi:hypothetical protein
MNFQMYIKELRLLQAIPVVGVAVLMGFSLAMHAISNNIAFLIIPGLGIILCIVCIIKLQNMIKALKTGDPEQVIKVFRP